jgi:hypothetical protein
LCVARGAFGDVQLDAGDMARESIRAMLAASIDVAVSAPNAAGCFLITGVFGCHAGTDPLAELLIDLRRTNIARIEKRLILGQEAGDVPADVNVPVLARFYNGMMQAISMQARDGMSREELEACLDPAMAALAQQ